MLDALLQAQSKNGVELNVKQLARLPLNEWYTRTSQLQTVGIDPKIYLDKTALLTAYGKHATVTNRYIRDTAGLINFDYASTLIAAKYANTLPGCPYTERVLLNITLYAMGSADIYNKLMTLNASVQASKGKYYPVFKANDELIQPKDNNTLATMHLMAWLTKPEGTTACIISAYDAIKPAYLSALIGLPDKRIAKMQEKNEIPAFMPGIPENWELRLAPQIFSLKFGMLDRTLIKVINQYKDGRLLKYREGLRGRKPITKNPYMERIYPEQKSLLETRIQMFVAEAEKVNLQGRYNIYYATPYYVAVSFAPADRVLFKPILDSVYARHLFELKSTTLANGDFL